MSSRLTLKPGMSQITNLSYFFGQNAYQNNLRPISESLCETFKSVFSHFNHCLKKSQNVLNHLLASKLDG